MENEKVMKMQTKQKFNWGELTIILLTLALGIFLSFTSETFLSYRNISSLFYAVAINFTAVIGFTYLMIMGEIDLSVGSMVAIGSMLTGMLTVVGVNTYIAIAITLVACTLYGCVNGFITVYFRVPSMMITLGSMYALRGVANVLCVNLTGKGYAETFQQLCKYSIELPDWMFDKAYIEQFGTQYMQWLIVIMIVVVVVLEILLKKTSIFKKMYFVGENLDTARVYGIKAGKIKIITFAVSALTAAIAGVLTGSRIQFAEAGTGEGLEFQMLTASVLGGASLTGGKGSILRSVVGLIFLQMITMAMTIFNIDPLVQQLVVGIILIVAVFIDTRLTSMSRT